jgi:hypothetical protein
VNITANIILPTLSLHLFYTRTLTALLQNLHSPTYISAISPVLIPYIVGLLITVVLVTEFQVPKVTVPIIVTHVPRITVKKSTKSYSNSRQSSTLITARVSPEYLEMLAYMGVTLPNTPSTNLVYQWELFFLTPF